MANLNESDLWEPGIYQLEEDDPVLGGPSGIDNLAPRQLASRSRYQRLRSVTPWVGDFPYPVDAFVSDGGTTWKSIAASAGIQPGSDGTKWVRWAFTAAELAAALDDTVAAHEAKPDPHAQYVKVAGDTMTGPLDLQQPAAFDSSAAGATTDFVQANGLRLSNIFSYATAVAMPVEVLGGEVIFGGPVAAPFIATLPSTAGRPPAAYARATLFHNSSLFPVTIQRSGTDVIAAGTGTITSLVLQPGDSCMLIMQSSGFWLLVMGSAQLSYSGSFAASVAGIGYQRLPSGLIIQWGITAAIASGATANVTLPVAFSSACFLAVGTHANYSTAMAVGNSLGPQVRSIGKTSISIINVNNNSANSSSNFNWIAIGA